MNASAAPAQATRPPSRRTPPLGPLASALAAWAFALAVGIVRWPFAPPPPHAETQQYSSRESSAEPLAEMFSSYDSVAAVTAALAQKGHQPQHTSSHKPPNRRYPPRDLDTLEVAGYEHLGQRGSLSLEFFNDRLYQARFEPSEVKRYLPRIHAAEPDLHRDGVGRSEQIRGNLRIATDIDLANSRVGRVVGARPYVVWQDLRLKRQLAQWEERYGPVSSLPG